MKNNKSKKIFIISIIILSIILVAGLVYAITATDLFKSDKALFFKYASQIFDEENSFVDNRIEQYNQKKASNLYENEGKIVIEDESGKNKISASFEGNVDNANESIEELVNLDYSEDVSLPVIYKKVKNTQGIKISELSKRFFTISQDEDLSSEYPNSQLEAISEVTNLVDVSKFKFTAEEKEKLKNSYLKVIENNLENANFTKVSTLESNGYSLSMSAAKFKEIAVELMKVLKDDEEMLEKINNVFASNLTKRDLDEMIEDANNSDVGQATMIITVYQNQNQLNKIEVQIADMYKCSLSKTSNDDSLRYKFNLESSDFSADVDISYSGLKTLEQVQENYIVSMSGDIEININIDNKVDFSNKDKISNFNSDEVIDLGKLEQEKLNKLMASLTKGLDELNKEKIEKAGIKEEESFVGVISNFAQYIVDFNSNRNMEKLLSDADETANETREEIEDNKVEDANTNTSTSSSSNIVNSMEKASKESFNEKFQQYEGDEVRGSSVKSLIMQVIANNMVDDAKQVEVTGDIKLTGDEVPDSITTSKYYKVKCSTDKDGYVNKVEIKEKK